MYPRDTVEQALRLAGQGVSDHETARICGVPVSAVRTWRSGTRRPRPPGREIRYDCPRCFGRPLNDEAYAYLLGLYLGDGHVVATSGSHRLTISCCNDWPGLIEAAADTMRVVMPKSNVNRRTRRGATDVFSQSKHWPCLFPQHGPGRKHTRRIELATWQEEIVAARTEDLVRGLIHSDGCRATNRIRRPLKDGDRWYEYPRYFFTNASDDIRQIFTDSLDRLGIAWKQANTRIVSVARKEAVARLDEFVGSKY